jgi:hypothetical protein
VGDRAIIVSGLDEASASASCESFFAAFAALDERPEVAHLPAGDAFAILFDDDDPPSSEP